MGESAIEGRYPGDANNPNKMNTGIVLESDAGKCKAIRAGAFWHPTGRCIIST